MSWLKDGFEFLERHFSPHVVKVGEKEFSNRNFTEIKPEPDPLHGVFEVTTLTALRDLIKTNVEKIGESSSPLIHIVNHQEVKLLVGISDEHGRRRIFARATPPAYNGFAFDKYMPLETFRVGIQAHFAKTDDREYLLSIASKVTDGDVAVSEDDGVSQQVTVNASLALKGTEKLRSRVTLAPFRTFAEADQPQSEFIFRARKGQNGAELALFEADGGKWKVAAVENIAYRLRDLDISLPIVA